MKKHQWLRCSRCGITDKTRTEANRHITGTYTSMRCTDCSTKESEGKATLCRLCCSTEHGTSFPSDEN